MFLHAWAGKSASLASLRRIRSKRSQSATARSIGFPRDKSRALLAKTDGTRDFPWRVLLVTEKDTSYFNLRSFSTWRRL